MIKVTRGHTKIKGNLFDIMGETYVLIKNLKQFYQERGLSDDRIMDMIEEAYTVEEGEKYFPKLGKATEEILNEIGRKAQNSIL